MLRRVLGVHLDHWSPTAAEILWLSKPTHVLLTEGAVEGIGEVVAICGPEVRIVVRNTYSDMRDGAKSGDQWMNAFIQRNPVKAGHWAANRLIWMADDFTDRSEQAHIILHSFCMPPVETQEQRRNLNIAEVEFANVCHDAGYEVILLNLGEGNPPGNEAEIHAAWEDLREAVGVTDYIGRHLYCVVGDAGNWHEYRYRLDPDWVPRHKMLATECGFEPEGWQRLGLREAYFTDEMQRIATQWGEDGILGGMWFAGTTRDPDRWGSWLATMAMWERWGQMPLLEAPQGPRNGPQDGDGEGGVSMYDTPEFHQWQRAYAQHHDGLYPKQHEYLKHHTAIHSDQPVTLEFIDAVEVDKRAAEAQLELLRARLPKAPS